MLYLLPYSRHSREEPSSTVELVREEASPVTTDCVSPDSGEPSSIPSVMISFETIKSSCLHSDVSDTPPVISSHEDGSPSSMTGSIVSSSSSSLMSHATPHEPNSNSQATNSNPNSKVRNSCQPDSTTSNASRSASQPDTPKKKDTNFNRRPVSDDVGYHSETSIRAKQMASVSNESEVSASSCPRRSSPESSMFTAYSPDYPQSVFSSDNSLPPPSNQGAAHTDSPVCDAQYMLHHPSSETSHSTITSPPDTHAYQVSSVNQHVFRGAVHHQSIHGQPSQGNQFFVSRVMMDSQPMALHLGETYYVNRGDRHYGDGCGCLSSLPCHSVGGSCGFMGSAPANFHPNWNTNSSSSMSFMKKEPSSPPPYATPYTSNIPPQGSTVIFSTPEILGRQRFNQSRSPPTQASSCHQDHSNVFPSQSGVFTESAATSIQGQFNLGQEK